LKNERRATEERVSATVRNYESEYLARSRQYERRLSAIQERSGLLARIRAMPAEIEKVYAEADSYTARINELRRRIDEEEAGLRSAEANFKAIEKNYKEILLAIHFPGITKGDVVVINRRTLIPEVLQSGDERRAWTFYDAGSGGKKTLLKICFVLALHQTAAENDLPVPRLLMIDSPMKNITPDVNEMHDCFLYATAAALKYGVNWISDQGWAKLRAELEAATPRVQEGSAVRRIGTAKSIASMLAR